MHMIDWAKTMHIWAESHHNTMNANEWNDRNKKELKINDAANAKFVATSNTFLAFVW